MPKFRKKPVVIEAMQWTGDNESDVFEFTSGAAVRNEKEFLEKSLVIQTLEGRMLADQGDWIIKGIKGEFYPCKPDIFEDTYELVEGTSKA